MKTKITQEATNLIILIAICFFANSAILKADGNEAKGQEETLQSCLDRFGKILAKYEKFEVFRKGYYDGVLFFSKDYEKQRQQFAKIYHATTKATIEDRLDEKDARKIKQKLREIGISAKSLNNSSDYSDSETEENSEEEETNDENLGKIQEQLNKIEDYLKAKSLDDIPLNIHTPLLNQAQNTMEEILDYSDVSKEMRSSQVRRFFRELLKLENDEDKAKSDRSVRDRERQELLKEAAILFNEILDEFEE